MLALLNDVFGEKTNEWLHGPMRQKKIENYSTVFWYIQDKYHIIFFWWQMFVGRKQKNAPFNTEGKSVLNTHCTIMIPKRSLLHLEAGNIFSVLFASTFVF